MKILVIDNYDSFVFNLVHILYNLGEENISVVKNDKISLDEIQAYDKILLSPGPGIPKDAGSMSEIIKHFAPSKSILGVCLGHQSIAESFGATLKNLEEPLHGVASSVTIIQENYLFENCPKQFNIGHYHSLVVKENTLGNNLEVLAKDEKGNIMSIGHKTYDVRGVQFHPESVLTENGIQIITNWIKH